MEKSSKSASKVQIFVLMLGKSEIYLHISEKSCNFAAEKLQRYKKYGI